MTRPESQPRHPLALLDLLIRVNAAAQNPGEEHEGLAEQFTQVMADPATGEQLRALRAQAEAEAGLPLDREPSTWDHRRTYAPGEQVWVVRCNVWHPAVIVRTDFTDYIVRIPSLGQLITATSCMLRAALAQAGGEG